MFKNGGFYPKSEVDQQVGAERAHRKHFADYDKPFINKGTCCGLCRLLLT